METNSESHKVRTYIKNYKNKQGQDSITLKTFNVHVHVHVHVILGMQNYLVVVRIKCIVVVVVE